MQAQQPSPNLQPLHLPDAREPILDSAFTADGRTLVSASARNIAWWNARTGKLLRTLEAPAKVRPLAISPDGRTLATGHKDGFVRLWSMREGKLLRTLRLYAWVDALAFAPDGQTLAASCQLRAKEVGRLTTAILLWNPERGDLLHGITAEGITSCLTFSPDSQTLAASLMMVGNEDRGEIRFWNVVSGQGTALWKVENAVPFSITYSPDGKSVLNANAGFTMQRMTHGETRLWDVQSGQSRPIVSDERAAFTRVTWAPDAKYFALKASHVEPDYSLTLSEFRLYQATDARRLYTLPGDNRVLGPLAFSPDGSTLAVANAKNDVVLWRPHAGK